MLRRLGVACAVAALAASGAHGAVNAIVTGSTVDVSLTPGPRPGGFYHFEGVLLDGTINDLSPSGASYTSRSEVDGQQILFVNGNATSGSNALATSTTSLDVTFTNDSLEAVDTTLQSTILPAGFGLFVGSAGCAAGVITSCSEAVGGPDFANFPYNGANVLGPLAFASFDFQISSGRQVLYTLSGSIALVRNSPNGNNVLVTNIADAANALSGFSLVTPAGSPTALAFVWDSTDIDLSLGTLAAGESRVLTYTTTTSTLTHSFGTGGCGLVAFSEFGDPVGRGGSIPPPTFARLAAPSDPCAGGDTGGLTLQRPSLFRLPVPTFEDGVLSVFVDSTVPEPATWAMLVMGFGLAGAAQRRRRAAAA